MIGVTLGIYGLTNALMQIPFGVLSDKYGRKKIILIGLLIFFIGSLICSVTNNIYYLLLGRALQGAGAISGVLMALLSDKTSVKNRTLSMAIVGVAIGAAFFSAFIIGPIVSKYFNLSGLFILISLLTMISVAVMLTFENDTMIPNKQFKFDLTELILDKKINPYFFDILILHTILTSIFVAIPVMMIDVYTMVVDDFPQFYSSIFILSLVITLPLLGFERKRPFAVRSASIIILSFSLVILYLFLVTTYSSLLQL